MVYKNKPEKAKNRANHTPNQHLNASVVQQIYPTAQNMANI